MEPLKTLYTNDRKIWREWLSENFEEEKEIWFVFPKKESGEESLSYNDAVEEALCFGWIDSTINQFDSLHRVQRFSPRRKGCGYSRANIERLIWLESQGMIHPKVIDSILQLIKTPYEFPVDILEVIRSDKKAWENYQYFRKSTKGFGLLTLMQRGSVLWSLRNVWKTSLVKRGKTDLLGMEESINTTNFSLFYIDMLHVTCIKADMFSQTDDVHSGNSRHVETLSC